MVHLFHHSGPLIFRPILSLSGGNPALSLNSWSNQDEPCRFRLRYILVPQHLVDADVIGPIPIASGSYHTYWVDVGGYDVLRYSIERVGDNLTYSCQYSGLQSLCSTHGHGLVGFVYGSINTCPTKSFDRSPLLNVRHHDRSFLLASRGTPPMLHGSVDIAGFL